MMKFREFEEQVREAVSHAVRSKGYDMEGRVELSVPASPALGDLSSPVALRLAKVSRRPPASVANELVEEIRAAHPGGLISSVEAHTAGFVNFRLDMATFAREVLASLLTEGVQIGILESERKLIAVEHTNVNPNKALHIGHARNLVLGDSIVRTMRRLGHRVQVLNYVDDSGAQVADVIVGFKFLGISDVPPPGMRFDAYCGDMVYTKVNEVYDKDMGLKEKQRLVLQAIETGNNELSDYAHMIVSRILAAQLQTCWRLRANYDLLNWESHILRVGMWEEVFEKMKRKGIAVFETEGENKGCWVVRDSQLGDEKVLVRSDGTVVYVAKDIPYAAWKIGLVEDHFRYKRYTKQPDGSTLWSTTLEGDGDSPPDHPKFGGADQAISVIDVRQMRLQKVVSRVLELTEGMPNAGRYTHRAYEVVALSRRSAETLGISVEKDFVHMQGRKGIYINVETLLASLRAKAESETRKRNAEASDQWVAEVAEEISIAALRFELLKQDPDKIIAFDIESSLRLEGETGPYLLYSYARASRILVKSGATNPGMTLTPRGADRLVHAKEIVLLKTISMYDKSVIEAAEYLSPKEVARYAHTLASIFNEFYEAVPVNSESDPELRGARLALVQAFRIVLRDALELIGLKAMEEI